jgi:hypothetical protein
VGAGAALAGLAGAAHRGGGGSTGTTIVGGALLLLTTVVTSGCSGAPIVPDPTPGDGIASCSIERSIVEGLDAAVGAVDDAVPDDAPKAQQALSIARGAVEEGLAAAAACDALVAEGRPGLGAVLPWLSVAMEAARGLLTILLASGVDIPDQLEDVLHSLGLASAAGPPIERDPPYQPAYFDVAVAR